MQGVCGERWAVGVLMNRKGVYCIMVCQARSDGMRVQQVGSGSMVLVGNIQGANG